MVKPGGTGKPRLAISARPAPFPPRRLRMSARPSALPSPKKYAHFLLSLFLFCVRPCSARLPAAAAGKCGGFIFRLFDATTRDVLLFMEARTRLQMNTDRIDASPRLLRKTTARRP